MITIVTIEDQPFLFVANRHDRMLSPPVTILYNDKGDHRHRSPLREVQPILRSHSPRSQCPIIGITILGPIADWLDAHVDRTIEPAQPGAPVVSSSKFNN